MPQAPSVQRILFFIGRHYNESHRNELPSMFGLEIAIRLIWKSSSNRDGFRNLFIVAEQHDRRALWVVANESCCCLNICDWLTIDLRDDIIGFESKKLKGGPRRERRD